MPEESGGEGADEMMKAESRRMKAPVFTTKAAKGGKRPERWQGR